MCSCVNIEMGSYDNQTTFPMPEHMRYMKYPVCNTPKTSVCIDTCLVDEIQDLWSQGIRTIGCCCGHNIKGVNPYIQVEEDDINKMLSMGYKKNLQYKFKPCNSFLAKSV